MPDYQHRPNVDLLTAPQVRKYYTILGPLGVKKSVLLILRRGLNS